jgi:hypothetical protein
MATSTDLLTLSETVERLRRAVLWDGFDDAAETELISKSALHHLRIRATEVHLRLMAQPGGPAQDDHFNGKIELARVPVEDDMIEHDGRSYRVRSVTFYTDGSAPYVVGD